MESRNTNSDTEKEYCDALKLMSKNERASKQEIESEREAARLSGQNRKKISKKKRKASTARHT